MTEYGNGLLWVSDDCNEDQCGACVRPDCEHSCHELDEAVRQADAAITASIQRCCRCRTAPVQHPGAVRPDGYPQDSALYCAACIDRCHEATDFGHVCVICMGPDELASGLVPGADAAWREAVRQAVAAIRTTVEGGQQ